ncbi:MAG: hypothetical protein ACHP78_04385 [Terriglobales bacterium]
MDNLDREIRRLASDIRAVEQLLVEGCGLTPVTSAVAAGYGSTWARRVRSLCQRACCWVARAAGSDAMLAVRAPQAD